MKTKTGRDVPVAHGETALKKLRRQMRKLKQKGQTIERNMARIEKRIDREAYEWGALGW